MGNKGGDIAMLQMNRGKMELTKEKQICIEGKHEGHFFEIVLSEVTEKGYLKEADMERIQIEMIQLWKQQIEAFNNGRSYSITEANAKRLLESMYFTLGFRFQALEDLDDSITLLKEKSVGELFEEGQSLIKQQFERLKEYFPTIDVKRSIRRLSKGMQKQVAFWLTICCMSDLLILDEPVDGLDPVMRKQVWAILLSEVKERNMTVLISSHNLKELEDVCDHVGIMNKGKIIIERSLRELQGNICKIQVACPIGMPKLPKEYKILHMSNIGRVYTLIVRANPKNVVNAIENEFSDRIVVDAIPLSLEEIFIYELGGEDYEVKEILF